MQWWILGPNEFDGSTHRAAFLARALARNDEVRYVYPTGLPYWIRMRLGRAGYRVPKDWNKWTAASQSITHISILGQRVPPLSKMFKTSEWWWSTNVRVIHAGIQGLASLNERYFAAWLRCELARNRRASMPQVVVSSCFEFGKTLANASAECLVYDCADNFGAYPGELVSRVQWFERRVTQSCNLVVVSSEAFRERFRNARVPIVHICNGVSDELVRKLSDSAGVRGRIRSKPPTVLYHGVTIPWRFNWPLFLDVASLCPELTFRLVTEPHHRPTGVSLPSNVTIDSWMPQERLGEVLAESALGFMPYCLTEPTLSGFPLKLFEYLSAGLPVVSTRLWELRRFGDIIRLSDPDAGAIAASIREEIAEDSPTRRRLRQERAAQFTWGELAKQYRNAIESVVPSGEEA